MKKLIKGIVCISLLSMCVSAMAATSATYFYVQNAKQMQLSPGKLTLNQIDPNTLWFADAPGTGTGFLTSSQYMKAWKTTPPVGEFVVTNPNATLIGYYIDTTTHQEKRMTAVLTLKNATYSSANNQLTYTVTKSLLVPDRKALHVSRHLTHATLLIDSGIIQPFQY